MNEEEQAKMTESGGWTYRQQQGLVDRALGKLGCAVAGHRWWRVIDARVCGRCGRVER